MLLFSVGHPALTLNATLELTLYRREHGSNYPVSDSNPETDSNLTPISTLTLSLPLTMTWYLDRTGQDRARNDRAGQSRTGKDRVNRTEPNRIEDLKPIDTNLFKLLT